ncbi:MAG: hypothetical protein ACK4N5_08330, partial [Myxococcales bacterium]
MKRRAQTSTALAALFAVLAAALLAWAAWPRAFPGPPLGHAPRPTPARLASVGPASSVQIEETPEQAGATRRLRRPRTLVELDRAREIPAGVEAAAPEDEPPENEAPLYAALAGFASEVLVEEVRVLVHDALVLVRTGVTAVFSLDPSIAEASLEGERISFQGRSPGRTMVTLVTASGVQSYVVTVEGQPLVSALATRDAAQRFTDWEARYDSQLAWLTNRLELFERSGARTLRLQLLNVTRLGELYGTDGRSAFPQASLTVAGGGRELVLLDELVEHSALTLRGVSLRGAHFRGGGFEVHAGITSPLMFENLVLPSKAEGAIGASYRLQLGKMSFAPHLYYFPMQSTGGGRRGALGTLAWGYGGSEDALRVNAELGYGGRLGGAFELAFDAAGQRLQLNARHQPAGIASVGYGRPHGSFADGAWSTRLLPQLS